MLRSARDAEKDTEVPGAPSRSRSVTVGADLYGRRASGRREQKEGREGREESAWSRRWLPLLRVPPRRTIPRNLEQIFYHSFVTSFSCHALEKKSVESSFVLESRREEGKEEGRKVGGEGSRDEEGSGAKEEAGRCRDRVLRGRGV